MSLIRKLTATYYQSLREPFLAFRKTLNTFLPRLEPSFLVYGNSVFEKDSAHWKNLPLDRCTSTYDKIDENKGVFIKKLCQEIHPHESILELGCNTGAVLFALAAKGYSRLQGVEINAGAATFALQRAEAEKVSLEIFNQDFPSFFQKNRNRRYDWVITYGATVELLHPAYDIFAALGRMAQKGIFLCLHPDAHKFPRWYGLLIRRHFPFAPEPSKASLAGGMKIYEAYKKPTRQTSGG